jgi:DnaK suppressor protein
MTKAELAHLREALEARQAELEELLRNREVIAVNSSADIFDQIQHATERDMAVGVLERESARLSEVRAALRRIQLGTFGICLDCEEEIGSKRLAAVPWASACIVCRESAEDRLAPPGMAA